MQTTRGLPLPRGHPPASPSEKFLVAPKRRTCRASRLRRLVPTKRNTAADIDRPAQGFAPCSVSCSETISTRESRTAGKIGPIPFISPFGCRNCPSELHPCRRPSVDLPFRRRLYDMNRTGEQVGQRFTWRNLEEEFLSPGFLRHYLLSLSESSAPAVRIVAILPPA